MKTNLGFFFSFITVFFWGISFIAIKIVVRVIPPITLGAVRFAISLFTLFVFTLLTSRGEKLPKAARKYSAIAGFWGITMYFIFENIGVHFTSPSQASLLISTVPIFTIAIADIYRKKRSSWKLYAMSFLSLVGVAIIILSNGFEFSSNILGDLLILLAAFSWGMYTLYINQLEEYDNLLATLEITKWGLIFLIPFSAVEMFIESPNVVRFLHPDILVWLLFLGVLCSGFGYVMWNYAIKSLGSRTSSNFIYLIPLVSIIADSLILKNMPSMGVYIGGTLVMIGVILGERFARVEEIKVPD